MEADLGDDLPDLWQKFRSRVVRSAQHVDLDGDQRRLPGRVIRRHRRHHPQQPPQLLQRHGRGGAGGGGGEECGGSGGEGGVEGAEGGGQAGARERSRLVEGERLPFLCGFLHA